MFDIRYAYISDAKDLAKIHSNSWKVSYKGIIPDEILDNFNIEKKQRYFERVIKDGLEENAVILSNNEVIGFICIGKCRDTDKTDSYGEVWGIYLLPEYFGRGVGTKLINWGLGELRNRGYKKVTLWVLEDNIKARKFYEKVGFKHDGTIKEINIGKSLNEYRYEKIIG
ncbi:N-acetyltransferase family protein [Clostridium sp. B9]|uniref:GNAT family N-acetyltransferase n=1 Tax=Clostridium sp. B9 TaxID=3423224 RepID=UPI003D2EADFD